MIKEIPGSARTVILPEQVVVVLNGQLVRVDSFDLRKIVNTSTEEEPKSDVHVSLNAILDDGWGGGCCGGYLPTDSYTVVDVLAQSLRLQAAGNAVQQNNGVCDAFRARRKAAAKKI